MKIWRKCTLLCLLALLCLTVGAAACEGGACLQQMELICMNEEPEEPEGEVRLMGGDIEGAEAALVAGMRELQESISIREYQITAAEFREIWDRLNLYYPELFMLDGTCRYYSSLGYITNVLPSYTMSPEEYAAARAVYRDGVDTILEQVDPDWSDLEKALFVHDYLAAHFEYDLTYQNHDVYRFFAEKTGVCEAYTKTFMAVARELDIGVSYVRSTFLNHAWNLVEIDGAWYHLDVTHDDPLADRLGYARHAYFLQSDSAAIALRKAAWEAKYSTPWSVDWIYGNGESCTDTTYDESFWQDAVSPFRQVDGLWYAVTKKGLKTWDGVSDSYGDTVDSFTVYTAGLDVYHGRLYYNSYYGIRCYEPFTGRSTGVLNFETTHGGDYYGQGLLVEEDGLKYEVYWYDSNKEYQSGWAECDLESYIAAPDEAFGYYEENGTLHLNAEDLSVAAICYDADGRMTGCSLLTGEDSCPLQQGWVKLVALTGDGSWLPLGEIVAGTVRTA